MKFGRSRTLQSQKYLQKKRKKFIVNTSISATVLFLIFLSIILLLRLSFFRINTIGLSNVQSINQDEIKSAAQSHLSGNYFYVIPRNNFLFYPKKEISSSLLSQFKKIDSLKIKVQGVSTLVIDVTERAPAVILCDGFKDDADNKCSYADKNGYNYDERPASSTKDYFIYYSNIQIPEEKFIQLQKFVSNLTNYEIKTTGMLVSEDGSYELYVKNIDESIAIVYFDDRVSLDKTLSNFISFWQSSAEKKIGSSEKSNFEYINFRFGNNIFYLLKQNDTRKIQ
jgi:hypothetical protein